MDGTVARLDVLLDLEARHEDLLRRLEELDKRVEKVLAEWQPARRSEAVPVVGFPSSSLVGESAELKRAG